ncbi:unnamed protein product [Mycena citricolor]|uniref:Phosphatidate cytidylyltransferase n=1 Tax=Mycena citricolor TaxID=2018698 RepID=A0AAD2HN74_9AGAR|nr:unnamed protein product [Mycena citricolor]CAK5277954.1 unnamed protein product [Mycena citricolor]
MSDERGRAWLVINLRTISTLSGPVRVTGVTCHSLLSRPSMPASSQSPPPRSPLPRRASESPARDAGVKGITRKVIRTLEGLGHLDPAPEAEMEDEYDDESEVAAALDSDEKRVGKQRASEVPEVKKKIDWEIPRKVFHSSIGFITLWLYLTPSMSPRIVAIALWAALAIIAPIDFVRLRSPAVERVYERAVGFLMRESERHGTNGTIWYMLGVNFALTFYPIDVATVSILILSWADTAASTIGRMYGPRTAPVPTSASLSWLPSWIWVPGFLLAPQVKENTTRRLRLPFAPRKSTAGFTAACVTGALVALMFWVGIAGSAPFIGPIPGVAEMRAVAEGADGIHDYHSQYSIAGQYLRSEHGRWLREWVPEGIIGIVAGAGAQTTPARFNVGGWIGLAATVTCAGIVSGVAEALDVGGMDDNLTLPIISGAALMLFFRVWGWAVGA